MKENDLGVLKREVRGEVAFENISASYNKNSPPILSDLNFKIRAGEKIGVIGRTGAGKSSLVKVILNFLDEVSGRILLDGGDVLEEDARFIRNSVFYISQDSCFFKGSLRENLFFSEKEDEQRVLSLLKQSGLGYLMQDQGLDKQIEEKGGNISQGEKQILCFLRAILSEKQIIIMDEATSNVDVQTEDTIEKLKEQYF